MNLQQEQFHAHLERLTNERHKAFHRVFRTWKKRAGRTTQSKENPRQGIARFAKTIFSKQNPRNINRWRSHLKTITQRASDSSTYLKNLLSGRTVFFISSIAALSIISYLVFFVAMLKQYDDSYWTKRINERTLSPIYGRDDVLVGAIQKIGEKTNYDLGFIPLPSKTPIPAVYRSALLEREDRGLRDGGVHQLFGIDFPRLLWAWLNLRGGSSLSMQIVKNLEGWGNEKSFLEKIFRKLRELPAAIQLYRHIDRKGGDTQNHIIRLYAGVHKIWTPDTGIRGIEAGARVTFDTTPENLTVAQQLLLSAVTGIPLAPPNENEPDKTPCKMIWPKKQNDQFDPSVEDRILASASDFAIRQFRIRKSQCKTLWRARHTAEKLYQAGVVFNSEESLKDTLVELDRYELQGVYPTNPFSGLSDRESVSISKRTRSVVTPHLTNLLLSEAKILQQNVAGEALTTNLLSGEQSTFVAEAHTRLSKIEKESMRVLCIPLSGEGKKLTNQFNCNDHTASAQAIVYAGAVDLSTGLLKRSYSNYGEIFEAYFSIGSLAKIPILVAAVKAGFTGESKVCPRSATRNGKKLRRVTEPKTGFQECSTKSQATLADATARSDNLAFYELANQLGASRLNEALDNLGLKQVSDPAYELSFGLYEASIAQVLKLSQVVFAGANGNSVRSNAPKLLLSKRKSADQMNITLTVEQAFALKQLIDSPVVLPNGTLRRLLALGVNGGKTGTSNSSKITESGDNFVAGKWSVFYSLETNTLGLMVVSSPRPSIPLSKPEIRGAMFVELEKLILEN